MKMLIVIILCISILSGCKSEVFIEKPLSDKTYHVSRITDYSIYKSKSNVLNGIWVSQFDMHPIYRDGNKQRDKADFEQKVITMLQNLKRDGFNTVFLQVRPNGDSMFKSEIYPTSKYIAGKYGDEIGYDAIEIYLNAAKNIGISVHAWINPFRLCSKNELNDYGKGIIYEWAQEGFGKRIELGDDGILYLDPAYKEATELIAKGAEEILEKYDFGGIHIDDYFYPTEFEFDDEEEFKKSRFNNIGDFRRSNVDRTVKALYDTVHKFENKVFGVAPAGNIYSLSDGWYADVYSWCKYEGYVDYIMPQLYYGFENAFCPFEKILNDWNEAVTNKNIALYIGLSAAKCELGTKGMADTYAGEKGKYEWRDNKDILARSLKAIYDIEADGFCVFTYSSFYDPLTGSNNPLTFEEKSVFCELI